MKVTAYQNVFSVSFNLGLVKCLQGREVAASGSALVAYRYMYY